MKAKHTFQTRRLVIYHPQDPHCYSCCASAPSHQAAARVSPILQFIELMINDVIEILTIAVKEEMQDEGHHGVRIDQDVGRFIRRGENVGQGGPKG